MEPVLDTRNKGPFALAAEPHSPSHGMDVSMFGVNMAFLCVMVLGLLTAGAHEVWNLFGHPWPWSLSSTALSVVVATLVLTVVSSWLYASTPDSQRNWFRARDGLDLERSSLILMLWAWEQPEASAWPKESTLWSVSWRADEAGMHAALMAVDDVSGLRLYRWEFAKAPEILRHRPWVGGPTPLWFRKGKSATLRAVLPHMTAHKRLALRAVIGGACADGHGKVA